MYEQYNKIPEENLTEIDKVQKGIVENQLNKWAGSLGVIEGDYDAILNKAKALGDLTYGGLTNMTPDQVTEKYDTYRDLYDFGTLRISNILHLRYLAREYTYHIFFYLPL